jgi:hypothetical protein
MDNRFDFIGRRIELFSREKANIRINPIVHHRVQSKDNRQAESVPWFKFWTHRLNHGQCFLFEVACFRGHKVNGGSQVEAVSVSVYSSATTAGKSHAQLGQVYGCSD